MNAWFLLFFVSWPFIHPLEHNYTSQPAQFYFFLNLSTTMLTSAFKLLNNFVLPPCDIRVKIQELWNNYIQIVPKKITIGIWVSIVKEPFMESKNQTRLWNYDYFSTIQWRPHLIWPSSHKEIWIFVKQVIGPFLPSFVTWMYVASTGRLCSQKIGLQTYSNFIHTFLTKVTVVPDNLQACQICKIM